MQGPAQETLKKGVQNKSEHESVIGIQEYHSALLECQTTLERRILIHILLITAYFLSILASINRDWISKFNTLFYTLRETLSYTPKFLIFMIPILIFSS